jgi:hypothetical protein
MVAIVVTAAMAFAALRTASNLWFSALYTFTTVVLLLAVIAARYGHRSTRAFWFGFAVFGWGFLMLGSGAWLNPYPDDENGIGGTINQGLLTSRFVLFLVPHLRQETLDLEAINRITANTTGIAHLLVTLTIALGGGTVAALMKRRRKRAEPGPSTNVIASAVILLALALGVAASAGDSARPPTPFFPGATPGEQGGATGPGAPRYSSRHLAAMDEPPLWIVSRREHAETVYRWFWLPTFEHPICVRVGKKLDGAELKVIVLDGKGGYAPGQIALEKSLRLRQDQWEKIAQGVEKLGFWGMSTQEMRNFGVDDGTLLSLEGIRPGGHHVVFRSSPISRDYEDLFLSVAGLAGLDPAKVRKE